MTYNYAGRCGINWPALGGSQPQLTDRLHFTNFSSAYHSSATLFTTNHCTLVGLTSSGLRGLIMAWQLGSGENSRSRMCAEEELWIIATNISQNDPAHELLGKTGQNNHLRICGSRRELKIQLPSRILRVQTYGVLFAHAYIYL